MPSNFTTAGRDAYWRVRSNGRVARVSMTGHEFVRAVQTRLRMALPLTTYDNSIVTAANVVVDGKWGFNTGKALYAVAQLYGADPEYLNGVRLETTSHHLDVFPPLNGSPIRARLNAAMTSSSILLGAWLVTPPAAAPLQETFPAQIEFEAGTIWPVWDHAAPRNPSTSLRVPLVTWETATQGAVPVPPTPVPPQPVVPPPNPYTPPVIPNPYTPPVIPRPPTPVAPDGSKTGDPLLDSEGKALGPETLDNVPGAWPTGGGQTPARNNTALIATVGVGALAAVGLLAYALSSGGSSNKRPARANPRARAQPKTRARPRRRT